MGHTEQVEQVMRQMSAAVPDFAVETRLINGIGHVAYANAPATLRDFFVRCFATHGDAPFLVHEGQRYRFSDVYRSAVQLAHGLRDEYGVGRGQRVAIAMQNCPEWIVSFIAVQLLGATAVALNSWWGGREMAYALRDCGARVVLADARRLQAILPILSEGGLRGVVVRCGETGPAASFDSLLRGRPDFALPPTEAAAEDIATIMYTSGSTGNPKGVASDNRALINQMWMWLHMMLASLQVQMSAATAAPPPSAPVALLTIPLFHINGCYSTFLMSVLIGQRIVMMSRWDVAEALRLIQTERVTSMGGVPTMIADLLNAPDRGLYDLSSLRGLAGGGAATPPERVRELRATLPEVSPSTGYAMTETNGAGTVLWGDDFRERPASVGRVNWPLVSIRLSDEAGAIFGQDDPGRRGEIWIRSVANMRGYWNQPEATAETLQDGWVRTGDIGEFDPDGFLYIVGRIKEIIIRGGENISCNEVEAAIFEHPDVLEACVFGIPDERLGEEVVVALVPRPGRGIDPEGLRDFLSGRLAAYKIPRHVLLHEQPLPRVASGKIDRLSLRRAGVA